MESGLRRESRVLVIGAGVIGLACAFRLAREGLAVTLVDRGKPGRGTSFGNAGHIGTEQVFPLASPEVVRGALGYLLDRESPLRIRPRYALRILPWLLRFAWASRRASFERGTAALSSLQRTAREDLAALLRLAGAERLLHVDGHLVLVEREASVDAAKSEIAMMRAHGVEAEWLSREDVRSIAPEVVAPLEGAWRFTGTGHVDDPLAVSEALERGFRDAGGEVLEEEVVDVEGGDAPFIARTMSGRRVEGARVLLACGAWSAGLAARLGYRVPLDTERGYHITLPATFPRFRIPVASYERKVIMTPMTIGLRMTGTVEFGGLQLPPDPHRFAMLERHLEALVPQASFEGMTTWMGYRPSLPDHLPVLGRVPDGRDIHFAFGHQHLGLTLAGVTARLVTDEMMGRPRTVDLAPFSPARFR
ncbi:MAG: NAD(P)/FAD-dependent oxidoreductase [Bacillota bacterium]